MTMTPPASPAPLFPLRRITLTCALIALTLGVLTLIGWMSGHQVLASVRAQYIPMAPSTAFCFSAIGLALLANLFRPELRVLVAIPSALVLGIAIAKLLELTLDLHFGLDAMLVRNPETFGTVLTGRMSPITATTFLFTAIGVTALASPLLHRFAGMLGAVAAVVAAVVLVGYWYGTPLLYGGSIVPVALTTATAFFVCGLAIVAAAGRDAWPLKPFCGASTRALLLRHFVPVLIIATLFNGWIRTRLLADATLNPAALSALSAIGFLVLILIVVTQVSVIVGGNIDRAEKARDEAQADLAALNALLEQKVLERTRQLREKNEQMEEELQMARELQLALLPRKFPNVPPTALPQDSALRFLSLYFPTTDVSGDFFTIVPLNENSVGIFICDVMGHGVRSALVTSMIHALVEEHAAAKLEEPGELLASINKALVRIFKQAGTTMFATGFYLIADVGRREWRFACAGHPAPIHVGPHGSTSGRLDSNSSRGPAMGLFPAVSYGTEQMPMTEHDLVMLFTDGLFEVEGETGELFTEELLLEAVRRHVLLPPSQMLDQVVDEVREFSHGKRFDDDVCVVGVKVLHVEEPPRADGVDPAAAEANDLALSAE